jgi:Rrp15p
MSSSKTTNRQTNRRYGKKTKNSNPIESLESLDRFAGSSEDEYDDEQHIDENDEYDNDRREKEENDVETIVEVKDSLPDNSNIVKHTSQSHTNDSDADVDDDDDDVDSNANDTDDNDNDEDNDIDNDGNDNEMDNINHDGKIQSQFQIATGMANAMSRILSAPIKGKATTSVGTIVLSKTKTPLQIQAEKEKKEQESLKETRRIKRERQIKALHIPLTVATNTFVLNNNNGANYSSLTAELEKERMHRRVATRGIVALFNAIAHHQVRPEQTAVEAASASANVTSSTASTTDATIKTNKSSTSSSTKLTKNGFLDLIKQKAITSAGAMNDTKATRSLAPTSDSTKTAPLVDNQKVKKWNALKDDYMMDSTKNWDEVDDDDDDDDDGSFHGNRYGNSDAKAPQRKKIRHDSVN